MLHFDEDSNIEMEGYDDTEEYLASLGVDARHTPVDKFMSNTGAGLALAWNMENGDDPFPI